MSNTCYIGNINTTAQGPLPGKVDLVTVDLATGKLGHTPAVAAGAFQAQADTIGELKEQIAALTATVQEQATQIQKVSAHLELSRPKPKLVKNQ
jgi:ABC-type transporter Mla subunit MlaD